MKTQQLYRSVAISALLGISVTAGQSAFAVQPLGQLPTATTAKKAPAPLSVQRKSLNTSFRGGDINPFGTDVNPFSTDGVGGDINPFSTGGGGVGGDINPFWGDINPFWGDINPFAGDGVGGDINPFWGDINPFGGDLNPFAADVTTYWSATGPQWSSLNQNWNQHNANNGSNTQFNGLLSDLNSIIDEAETVYGSRVTTSTGQSFRDGFATDFFADYGIDLNDSNSLRNISQETRSRLFLDWYDGLQSFSGTDQVDHWMATINWSPAITQDQGEGHDAVVGLLDVAIAATDQNIEYLVNAGGFAHSPNEHGAAVASLIAGRHDGMGVMGIAPRATIHAFSPFDASGTASFAKVSEGINALTAAGANVINMSLGVPGYALHQEIANFLSSGAVQKHADNTVFVIASGNDGITQGTDVQWNANASVDSLLIVGSVNPNKQISSFSNGVGSSCFVVSGQCAAGYELKDRFLVAPGELILVSDNNGGTTRLSGTSFAAPLVTGAVSLVHDRWPWLQKYAKETADIILQTAQDLGAPGVDEVYGHGLLDVAAAQSPIDFNNLVFHQANAQGQLVQSSAADFRNSLLVPGQLDIWQNTSANVFAVENIGDTYRDFTIPLSTLIYEQSATFQGNTERFQRHVHRRLLDWAEGGSVVSFSDQAAVGAMGDWSISMIRTPISRFSPETDRGVPYHSGLEFASRDGKTRVSLGEGFGATFLTQNDALVSDAEQDREAGGVNPFLGFASGGSYASVTTQVLPGMNVNLGFTQARDDHSYVDDLTGNRLRQFEDVDDYRAQAFLLGVNYAVADSVTLNASYTRLNEATGLFGAQGAGVLSLGEGAVTNALTIGATYDITSSLSISAAGTMGRTLSGDFDAFTLGVAEDGLTSTAFEIAATNRGIFRARDTLTLKLAQPLYVETGELLYRSVQVTDRATGALGAVNQFWDLGSTQRRLISEAQYGVPIFDGASALSLFGRIDMNNQDGSGSFNAFAGGARLSTSF
ncbi:MAG: S8 family peptidase [Pseudomonadota bacterium]